MGTEAPLGDHGGRTGSLPGNRLRRLVLNDVGAFIPAEALSHIGQVFAWDIATAWAQPEVTSEKAAA